MTHNELKVEKLKYRIKTNGGISLPAAGFVYWLLLGIAGYFLQANTWALASFFTSGLIFPLGLLLGKVLRSDLMARSPLSSLAIPALSAMFLSWPLIIVAYYTNISMVPLVLAIGMSLHWPAIGWMYDSKVCIIHAITRVALVSIMWFLLPEQRFTVLPLTVSAIYFVTIFGLKYEVAKAKKHVA